MLRSIHARLLERKLVSLRNSKIHGIGVFANTRIAADKVLARYEGRVLTADRVKLEIAGGNPYLLELPDGRVLDGSVGSGPGRFFNHSCVPSARLEYRDNQPLVISSRTIAKGEEITIDYGFDPEDVTRLVCRCGSSECVGYIVGEPYRAMVREVWGASQETP